jgi:hypothetical protein
MEPEGSLPFTKQHAGVSGYYWNVQQQEISSLNTTVQLPQRFSTQNISP